MLVALAFVAGLPATAHALPPVTLSRHSLLQGESMTFSGRNCKYTGLGSGYGITLENGKSVNRTDHAELDQAGRWSATYVIGPDFPAGLYTVKVTCFERIPNEDYPRASFVLKPGRAPRIDGALQSSHSSGYPGDDFRLTARGVDYDWKAGVFLMPEQRYLGSLPQPLHDAGRTSSTSGVMRLPADVSPGPHRIIAQSTYETTAGHALYTLATTITVLSDAPAAPPSPSATPSRPSPTPSPTPSPSPPAAAATPSPTAMAARPAERGSGALPALAGAAAAVTAATGGALVVRRRRRARRAG